MDGWEISTLGIIYVILTAIVKFGFKMQVDGFYLSIGILIGGLMSWLFQYVAKSTTSSNSG